MANALYLMWGKIHLKLSCTKEREAFVFLGEKKKNNKNTEWPMESQYSMRIFQTELKKTSSENQDRQIPVAVS